MWQKMLQVGSGGSSETSSMEYFNLINTSYQHTFDKAYKEIYVQVSRNGDNPICELNGVAQSHIDAYTLATVQNKVFHIENIKSGDKVVTRGSGVLWALEK